MKTEYKHYTDITKEILDNIKVGMLVKINDWKRPMKVVGISENYFCMMLFSTLNDASFFTLNDANAA